MRSQRLLALICVIVTSICCVQLLASFLSSTEPDEFRRPLGKSLKALTATPKMTVHRVNQNLSSNDLMLAVRQRKRTSVEKSSEPYRRLRPGGALIQETKKLSNGTTVGWIPAYNRTVFKLLHASPPCKAEDVYVAVIVSGGKNFLRRQAIRKTWGSQLKTVFVLGANETVNPDLETEAIRYKDIVQADFREGYYNLTYNTITALRWVTMYCPAAEYIIKGDDDSWFNIDLLKTEVAIRAEDPMILGMLFVNAARNVKSSSKWYTPNEVLAQKTYPKFVSGAGYVVTRTAATLLYKKLLMEPLILNLEDLFITGFLANEIGIERKKIREFYNHRFPKKQVNGCTYGQLLQSHEISPSEMMKLWKDIRNPNLRC